MNVAIVEDDKRYRESLETLFRHARGFALHSSHGSAGPFLERLQDCVMTSPDWDLVLMDIGLPDLDGIEATRRIKRLCPESLVVLLTVFEEPDTILNAICAGADGYLLKKTPPQEILAQLRLVAEGGAPLTANVARSVLELLRVVERQQRGLSMPGGDASVDHRADGGLTTRESEVLRCLTQGLAYKQTAQELGISLDTVRFHVRAVYRKLQVHSVAEAVSRAIRERMV